MPDKVVEGYQLSPQQARIWLLQQLDGGLAYRAQCAVLIDGDLDVGLLRGAIREIVARHEILRTDFHLLAGMTVPLQSIGTEPVAAFREIDLSDCEARQKSARFEEIFQEEAADCLDFERGSRARFCLVRMSVAERILVVSAPAVCADSWSLKNLFREVARAYGAQGRGGENTERPVQYVDFVEWQRERLEGQEDRGERLRGGDARPGVSPELKLGLERESERGSKFAPKSVRLALDGETVRGIERVSGAHRITPDVFLLACWQVLMWRLSGNKEVRIDSLCEGRGRGKLQQAMGAFASYSPAQCHLEPDYRLEELLETVERSWRAARLGVDQMLREERETRGDGGVARRAGAIGFWYEEWPGAEREGGVKFSYWRQYCCIDRFDLRLGAYRKDEGLEIEIEHDPSIYGREGIELIGERYQKVIQSALRNEAGQIGDWEVIGERELERLTVGWNRTERGEGEGRCIHELIGEQARIRGEAIAVSYRQEQLSFAELERRAGRLAVDLRRKGVGPESVVGLYVGRSTEMLIGLLGILKAGGAYLPLEVGHPGERLRAMLEESGARVVVTRSEDAWGLPWCDSELVMVDGEGGEREGCGEEEERWSVSAENLAYVIYTSGSTGKPKGVMVRHGAVVNLLKGLKETVYEGGGEEKTVSLNAPLSFDASVKQVIQMAEGKRVCIVPEEERVDGRELMKYLGGNVVEVMDCTPSQWRMLKEAGLWKEGGALRRVLVGGEAIDEESWREMRESREISYYNVYGPTECTVDATTCGVKEYREPTIGRPIRNTRIYILDERGGVSPTGVTGEIYIGGEGLGRGYIGDARQTAEKFVPDPYVKVGGERMYRTGDRGRYVEGGRIEYGGRRDGQVKVRGHRVELGEIEEVLRSYPGVREAVVIVREDQPGEKWLVSYVVTVTQDEEQRERARIGTHARNANGRGPTQSYETAEAEGDHRSWKEVAEGELKKYLREKLPEYMAPAAVVLMESMPLTQNGKVDRDALPKPEEIIGQDDTKENLYRNMYEEMISGIWKEVLKVKQVKRSDNFFTVGGHSLLATRVISRIRDVFGIEIGVKSIFEDATIEGLGHRVEEAIRGGVKRVAPPLIRAPREERLPLSYAQQRLWFIEQLDPGNAVYNCTGVVRLDGRLNLEALERVVNEIVRRHEVLRTRIEVEEGEPAQVIDEWEPRRLEVEYLTDLTPEERVDEVARRARAEAKTGFDLRRGPMIRVKVLKLGEEEQVALFTMHHIASDAWSMGVLAREVCALYQAFNEGEASPLPELEIQYADYAKWQREYLAGGVLEDEVRYWKERLKDAAVIKLPTDRPRPVAPSHRGGLECINLGRDLSDGLRALCRREGATLFMTLMAAFKLLLMRYSGEEDVSVGTASANRNRREVEGLIGFFVNTLVIRSNLGGNPSFRELVGREREAALGAYAHQEAPFEKLVEELNPERDLSRSPLFQAMMALQNVGREELKIRGLMVKAVEEETGTAKFDLTLMLTEEREEISGSLEYSLDLYEAETARRIARHYKKALEEAVRDAGQKIREMALMDEEERRQIIEGRNETERDYGEPLPAHEMIALQARLRGDAIALKSGRAELSYGELDRRSNRLGNYLKRKGVGPGEVVGICAKRSIESVIALLGVLKAGAAYAPIDEGYPDRRVKHILEDAGVRVLLTQGEAGRRLERARPVGEVVDMEGRWGEIAEEGADSPGVRVEGDGLAYVIYTSGSTGKPKGVMVTHRGLTNYLQWATEVYRIGHGEGAPVNSPMGFDLTVTSLYGPLVNGKSVNLLSEEEGIEALANALREESGYSLVKITPAHLDVLAQQLENSKVEGRAGVLVIGGEELGAAGLKYWQERAPETRLINEYGPTETVVGCCVYEVKWGEGVRDAVPIGRPIANAQMYVLDEELEPAPVGVKGELYVSGAGVARGYIRSPGLTAERFIPNQFCRGGGGRMYRTGDYGRYVSDGNIEFIGRADDQVKVRGYRVELAEIEAALGEHSGVRQSVVVARWDERGGRRLAGYVVGQEGVTAEELKRHVRERLPEYMVPEAILVLKEMPLTAHGKIDRKRLPLVTEADRGPGLERQGPRTPAEEMVVGIFEEALKLERVGIQDNFFDMGGHSLLATRLVSRVRDAFGIEIGVKVIFEEPTAEGLARRIEEAMRSGEKEEAPPLVRAPRREKLPLSFAQQRLWVLDQLMPNNPFYNISGVVALEGRLNIGVLERSVNEIVRRHEVLRTRIEVEDGSPAQVIDEWEPRGLNVEDLTGLTHEERELEVKRIINEEAKTGFDLRRGPLIRLRVLELEKEEHVVVFTTHHIASDAWSMGVLVREMGVLYEAINTGESAPLPGLKIQYADYAAWQRKYLRGTVLEKHLAYWKKQLSGKLPALDLPADHPRHPVPSYRGAAKSFSLSIELFQSLRALSRREHVTLFMLLLAAFKTLLYKYTAQEDIIVGTAIANRNRFEIEPLIGFFVNMLPLRTDLSGNPRFTELLKQVRDVAIGGYAHQDLPFERLVKEIQPERTVWEMPLFNVAFGVQNAPEEELRLNGLEVRPIVTEQRDARYDLTLWVREGVQGIQIEWTYSKDLFEESTIVRMHSHFETLLSSVVDRPDARLSNLDISPRAEAGLKHEGQHGWDDSDMGEPTSIKRRGVNLPTEPAC